jgi:hypothetical protein
MDYLCTMCNYETNDLANYHKHKKTIKHLKNKEIADAKDEKEKEKNTPISCATCNGLFSKCEIDSHLKKCVKVTVAGELIFRLEDENINLKNEVKLLKNTMTILINEKNELIIRCERAENIIKTDREKEELILKYSNDKEEDNKYLKTLVNSAGDVVNNAVKFLTKKYPNAPVFEKMRNFPLLEKEDDMFGMVISKYMNKVTYRYLGDVVVNYYVKENPNDQALWVSDVSRFTYELKRYIDENEDKNKSKWIKDKKGVTVCNEAIIPLLEFVRSILVKNISITMHDPSKLEITRMANELIGLIDNGILKDEINRYIAPFFQVKPDDMNKKIDYYDNINKSSDKTSHKKTIKSKKTDRSNKKNIAPKIGRTVIRSSSTLISDSESE